MSYLSASKTLSVTDYCYHTDYYGHSATASATVSVEKDSNTASYSIKVTTSNENFIQIYLKIGSTVVKNYKDTSGKETYTYSGTTTISGNDVKIKLGVGCSQYTESTMTFTEKTLSRKSWSEGTDPTLTITEVHNDEGVNKITFSGKLGKNGTNNALSSAILYYTTDGTNPTSTNHAGSFNLGSTSGGSYSKEITFNKNLKVRARAACIFKYNTTRVVKEKNVKYCTIPTISAVPVLTYTKSRLTIKEPWTFSWTGANGTNCPIVSYRLRLYKGRTSNGLSTITIKDAAGNEISNRNNAYDTGNTNTTLVIDPSVNGFEPGDIVKLTVLAQGKTANTENLWLSGNKDTAASSIEYVVQNAGIVQIKDASGWHEGQVYVKDTSGWHEAESVQIKDASGWHESE